MKKIILCLSLILLTACGNGRSVSVISHRQATSPKIAVGHVTVKVGDNLYSIATKNKVSTAELVKLNNIRPPFTLSVGQKIYLPKIKIHRVSKGDTLYSLARYYKVSVAELAQVNDFSKRTKLNTGMRLNIPKTATELKKVSPHKAIRNNVSSAKNTKLSLKKKSNAKVSGGSKATKKGLSTKNKKTIAVRKVENLAIVKAKQKARLKRRSLGATPKGSGKFIYPVRGKIISKFGRKSVGISNDGINISAKKGASVVASDNGVVVYAGSGLKNFGNVVLVKHAKKFVTVYAHLNTIKVNRGDVVKQGGVIGSVGNTGSVKNSQLHFQIRKRRQILNPKKYLR